MPDPPFAAGFTLGHSQGDVGASVCGFNPQVLQGLGDIAERDEGSWLQMAASRWRASIWLRPETVLCSHVVGRLMNVMRE
jgi:hypothetical protein